MASTSSVIGLREALDQALPLVREWTLKSEPSSTGTLGDHSPPDELHLWHYENPVAPGGTLLVNAIRQHPHDNDFRDMDAKKCYPLKLSGYEYMYSEADVASAVSVRICRCMLLKYAKRATGLSASMEPWWTLEDEPSSLLAGPLHQAERTFVVNNVVSAAAVGQHALEQQSTGVLDHSAWAACSPSSAGGSSRYIVLNLSLRRQGVGVAPGPYKPAMMVQVERISVLMEDGQTPLDLLAVYKDPSHKMHGLVKRVVAQLFTYLCALGLCHGALTCWNATWLVYVPPEDRNRKVMYLSAPILANAVDPTVLRALSWQQLQALCFAVSDRYPARPASGAAAAGGGNGGGGGQAGRGTSYQQDGATAAAAAAAGAEASGHPPAASMRSSSPTATPTAQHQQQELQLRFLSLLASGRDGTVFSGVCNGQSVAIKVYSWEGAQVVAYARETRAYQALARLQGSVVPKVLAQGRLTDELAGVRCLVMEMVEGGRPLSDCPWPFSRQVVDAALGALEAVHATEGCVHGDIRLENLLLVGGEAELAAGGGSGSRGPMSGQGAAREVEAEAGAEGGAAGASAAQTAAGGTRDGAATCSSGGGSALRCVLLDFGGSWLGGTEQEQAEEREELRQLLEEAEEE